MGAPQGRGGGGGEAGGAQSEEEAQGVGGRWRRGRGGRRRPREWAAGGGGRRRRGRGGAGALSLAGLPVSEMARPWGARRSGPRGCVGKNAGRGPEPVSAGALGQEAVGEGRAAPAAWEEGGGGRRSGDRAAVRPLQVGGPQAAERTELHSPRERLQAERMRWEVTRAETQVPDACWTRRWGGRRGRLGCAVPGSVGTLRRRVANP